jgi:hypothetical protein
MMQWLSTMPQFPFPAIPPEIVFYAAAVAFDGWRFVSVVDPITFTSR